MKGKKIKKSGMTMDDDNEKKKKTCGGFIFGNDFSNLSRSRTLHDLGAYMTLMECGARGLVVVLWSGARYRRGFF